MSDNLLPVQPGFTLFNGAIVVDVTWQSDPKPVQSGVALAIWPGNIHPYVVWGIERDSVAADVFNGSYFMTLDAAYTEYRHRSGT